MADIDVTPARSRNLARGLTAALAAAALAAALLTALPGLAAAATGVTLTVAKSGAEYTSVQAAVNAVPENPTVPYTILIGPGTIRRDWRPSRPASRTSPCRAAPATRPTW